jgi:hypothetical protein
MNAQIPVVGLLALWSGNENALFIGNPVIQHNGEAALTRGENWSIPQDLTAGDVSGQPGYVPFTTPTLKKTSINEGDVAWIAGSAFMVSYRKFLRAGGDDVLSISSWTRRPDGCSFKFGLSKDFYLQGAKLAAAALGFYETRLSLSDSSPGEWDISAARAIYDGVPGIDIAERQIVDAIWYHHVGDLEMYQRALTHAAIFNDTTEEEIESTIEKRASFYAKSSIRVDRSEFARLRAEIENLRSRLAAEQRLRLASSTVLRFANEFMIQKSSNSASKFPAERALSLIQFEASARAKVQKGAVGRPRIKVNAIGESEVSGNE